MSSAWSAPPSDGLSAAEILNPDRNKFFPVAQPGHISPERVAEVLTTLTTTGSTAAAFVSGEGEGAILPQTNLSGPLINWDDFRIAPRFAGIDGAGFSTVILDTGIDLNHPFFGSDTDNNGVSDRIVFSFDFSGSNDPDASDFDGHGSNVSSIVASSDSAFPGMATGANIIHLKVFTDAGGGNFGDVEEALRWVVANAATFNIASVNLSLGDTRNHAYFENASGLGLSDEFAALAAMNIIAVAATGNSFSSFSSQIGVAYPAADPNNIAVGAVYDSNAGGFSYGSGARANSTGPDFITPFSQRHPIIMDIMAPGAPITGANESGGRVTQHGTSQASPHIAGIAVLAQDLAVQTLGRRLTLDEFRQLLQTTAVSINDGDDENDNVVNTGLNFPRVDVLALGDAILALRPGSISGKVFRDNNADGQSTGDPALANWTVFLDDDNDGILDAGTTAVSSNDVPKTINNLSTVASTLSVSGVPGRITDLNVSISIAHTAAANLDVYLVSPSGTRIELFTDVGGTGDNFTNTVLDDESGTLISSGSAPFTGNFRPEEALAGLDNENPNGTWQLFVGDDSSADTGALTSWSLTISAAEVSTQSATDGSYAFSGLKAGTYRVREVLQSDFTQSVPASGLFSVTLAAGETVTGRDFGNAPTARLSINDITVTEGTGTSINALFTISLATVRSEPVTVDFTTSNGTALAGSDFTATSGTLTFLPGEISKTVSVPIVSDSKYEGNEEFFVNLSNATLAAIVDGQGQATILDNDPAPTLSINNVTLVEGHAGTTDAVFTVTLSGTSEVSASVNFATADGSATAGEDYVANAGTLTFAPGQTTQTITISILGETLFEINESFSVVLSGAIRATISDPQGDGSIRNDDVNTTLVSIDDVTLFEGTGNPSNAAFTVRLSEVCGAPITVQYATVKSSALSPSDFTASSGSLTFAPGETVQTVSVLIVGDAIDEPTETFFVKLISSTNAKIDDSQGVGTILDDDLPPELSIGDVLLMEGTGTSVNAIFIVSLSAPSTLPVAVNYAAADGTALYSPDYIAKRATVTLAAGQTSKAIIIPIKADRMDEFDEFFFVNLSHPVNATIRDGQGQCTIIDDDLAPTLTIKNAKVTEGTNKTVRANFTVSLSAASGHPVTVDYTTASDSATASSDFTSASGSLTFPAGHTTKTISVVVAGDALDELNETFFVDLSNPTNAAIAINQAVGTITDDDATPKLTINSPTVIEGTGGEVSLIFTVTLSAPSSLPVTVSYATADGTANASDYTSTSGQLIFNASETSKTISVPILGDSIAELKKSVLINLSNAINAVFAKTQGVGWIWDND